MRLIRMSERSVYYGQSCLHCHKKAAKGRACLVSTYYVDAGSVWVRTQSRSWKPFNNQEPVEMQLRIVYHRSCLEGILRRGPNDAAIEVAEFNDYRAALLERITGGSGTCPTPSPEYEPYRARQDL